MDDPVYGSIGNVVSRFEFLESGRKPDNLIVHCPLFNRFFNGTFLTIARIHAAQCDRKAAFLLVFLCGAFC